MQTYAIGPGGDEFSTADTSLRSNLPFQSRLQLPRFLIAGDTTTPLVVLVNRTADQIDASSHLEIDGPGILNPTIAPSSPVPAHGESHLFWTLRADSPGSIELTGFANSLVDGDAEQRSIKVHEDGISQELAATIRTRSDSRTDEVELHLPDPLDPHRTTAPIQVATSPAVAALDALPYLIDYPYGCVEQTMSRFLPAIVVRHALVRLGLNDFAADEVLPTVFAQQRELTPSGRAVLALAIAHFGTEEQKEIIIRNLANQTVREESDLGSLIHWGETSGHWNALDSANEATALSLLALFELAPDHDF